MDDQIATAKWGSLSTCSQLRPYEDGMVFLGVDLNNGTAYGVRAEDEGHIFVRADQRAGKQASLIGPNLGRWPGSVLVFDIKDGELASVYAERRGEGSDLADPMHQKVAVWDPFKVATVDDQYRVAINVIDWIDVDRPGAVERALVASEALVPDNPQATDPIWNDAAKGLVASLMMHVASSSFYVGRRNLLAVYEAICLGDEDLAEILEDGTGENPGSPMDVLFDAMATNEVLSGFVSRMGKSFGEMRETAMKQWAGVKWHLETALKFMQIPEVQEATKCSDFAFSELKTRPEGMTIFLSMKQKNLAPLSGLLRLIFEMFVSDMQDFGGKPAKGERVLVVADEFPSLKRLESMVTTVTQLGGSFVKCLLLTQTTVQVEEQYKKMWTVIEGMSSIRLWWAIGDVPSREHLSKKLGEREILRQLDGSSSNVTTGSSDTNSLAVSEGWNVSDGSNQSTSQNRNQTRGENQSISNGYTNSSGFNWGHTLFGWLVPAFLRKAPQANYGHSSSSQTSSGDNHSLSVGENQQQGTNHSEGRNGSETKTRSHSDNRSETKGTSRQPNLQKKRLLDGHEVAPLLGVRFKEQPHYPGIGLIDPSNSSPVLFQRINYWEHPLFYRTYGRHPKHGHRHAPKPGEKRANNTLPRSQRELPITCILKARCLEWLTQAPSRRSKKGIVRCIPRYGQVVGQGEDLVGVFDQNDNLVETWFTAPTAGSVRGLRWSDDPKTTSPSDLELRMVFDPADVASIVERPSSRSTALVVGIVEPGELIEPKEIVRRVTALRKQADTPFFLECQKTLGSLRERAMEASLHAVGMFLVVGNFLLAGWIGIGAVLIGSGLFLLAGQMGMALKAFLLSVAVWACPILAPAVLLGGLVFMHHAGQLRTWCERGLELMLESERGRRYL